jgi:hypothetical protein
MSYADMSCQPEEPDGDKPVSDLTRPEWLGARRSRTGRHSVRSIVSDISGLDLVEYTAAHSPDYAGDLVKYLRDMPVIGGPHLPV